MRHFRKSNENIFLLFFRKTKHFAFFKSNHTKVAKVLLYKWFFDSNKKITSFSSFYIQLLLHLILILTDFIDIIPFQIQSGLKRTINRSIHQRIFNMLIYILLVITNEMDINIHILIGFIWLCAFADWKLNIQVLVTTSLFVIIFSENMQRIIKQF